MIRRIDQALYSKSMNHRLWLMCFFLFVTTLTSMAQLPSIMLMTPDSSFKQRDALVLLEGQALIGSNTLDNLFFKRIFRGGNLENSHLNAIAERSKGQNRAGFLAGGDLEFYNFRDTLFNRPELGLHVNIGTHYHGGINFSEDLFRTVFRGNKSFAGDTASLAPLSLQYQAWQKFGIGLFNKSTLSGFTLSLVEGQAYNSLIVTEANMYTSLTGDSLALSYNGEYLRSDTSRFGWANGSGVGVALDFDYNLPLKDHKGVISISMRDLGFVFWNKQSQKIQFDSITNWTGLNVDGVFDFATDSLHFPNMEDSIYRQVESRSFFAALPATIHLRYARYFSSHDFYEAGMIMLPNRAAIPMMYAGASHFVGEHFTFSERLYAGGYGRFGVGAEIQWMPKGSWLFRLGTKSLGGLTMSSARSRDIYFSIGKSF
jgi:Family of unknown function (DUF5723)